MPHWLKGRYLCPSSLPSPEIPTDAVRRTLLVTLSYLTLERAHGNSLMLWFTLTWRVCSWECFLCYNPRKVTEIGWGWGFPSHKRKKYQILFIYSQKIMLPCSWVGRHAAGWAGQFIFALAQSLFPHQGKRANFHRRVVFLNDQWKKMMEKIPRKRRMTCYKTIK